MARGDKTASVFFRSDCWDLWTRLDFFAQIIIAVEYLHQREICVIHRDIKGDNCIGFFPQGPLEDWWDYCAMTWQLCDFGLALF